MIFLFSVRLFMTLYKPFARVSSCSASEYATANALQLRAAVCIRVHWQVANSDNSNKNKVTIGWAVKNSRKQLNLVTKKWRERKTLRIRNK